MLAFSSSSPAIAFTCALGRFHPQYRQFQVEHQQIEALGLLIFRWLLGWQPGDVVRRLRKALHVELHPRFGLRVILYQPPMRTRHEIVDVHRRHIRLQQGRHVTAQLRLFTRRVVGHAEGLAVQFADELQARLEKPRARRIA